MGWSGAWQVVAAASVERAMATDLYEAFVVPIDSLARAEYETGGRESVSVVLPSRSVVEVGGVGLGGGSVRRMGRGLGFGGWAFLLCI